MVPRMEMENEMRYLYPEKCIHRMRNERWFAEDAFKLMMIIFMRDDGGNLTLEQQASQPSSKQTKDGKKAEIIAMTKIIIIIKGRNGMTRRELKQI